MNLEKSGFTQAMVQAAESLMLAMAFENLIRPIVTEYQRDILAKHQFKVCSECEDCSESLTGNGKVITEPNHSYLMSNEDSLLYYAACNAARDAAKLKYVNPDDCPLLAATHMRVKAENAFFDELGHHKDLGAFKEHWILDLEQRKTALDLSLRLLSPFVAPHNELMKRVCPLHTL